ncbi:MAG: flagellar biosynthesis protein FlhB [Planctomycetota bacterium]|nr:flagellar biosynthesis protein FlhB [Planctomycetota bacterium]
MEESGDKTQDATPHRRQQAREEGQVVQSQDLASAALMIVGLLTLWNLCGPLIDFFGELTRSHLGGDPWLTTDSQTFSNHLTVILMELSKSLLPIMGVLVLAGILSHLLQVGFLFLPNKLLPDWSRVNPISGLSRIFSMAGLVRLLMGLFKIAIVSTVAYSCVVAQQDRIIGMSELDLPDLAKLLVELLIWISVKVCMALFILALLDYLYQYYRQEQSLMMTTQQVREEMKNMQGDPQLIARRRSVQRQLAMNRMKSVIPKADVVITNPTELAVAIQYDPETMRAPIVVAKGAGTVAARIRRLALEAGVPIIEKKPLAQGLFKDVDLNHPIPDSMYAAVAEVLAYVYQLKGKPLPKIG